MRDVTDIIIHCSATRPSWAAGRDADWVKAEITRWHVEDRGWRGIAYNELIMPDGTRIGGRDLDNDGDYFEEIGAHVKGHNRTSYGICLIGGHGSAANDAFSDHFTAAQDRALREAIADAEALARQPLRLSGHNEYANKACPGFNVRRWYDGKKPKRTSLLESSTIQVGIAAQSSNALTALEVVPKLSGPAQIIALLGFFVIALGILWMMKERRRKFHAGDA